MAEGGSSKRKAEGKDEKPGPPAKKVFGHWSQGLLASMDDPELKVDSDDKVVIIKDKYPKAKYHFLIMPRISIPSLKSLTPDHLELLKHCEKKGREIAEKTDKTIQFRYGYHAVPSMRTDKTIQFRYGYHAVPSMSHLHLHVISQDFDSPSLKTKKHWNSFTTEYFKDSKDIIKRLEKDGKVQFDTTDYQNVLKRDLECHVCKKPLKNIPTLKTHIKLHDYSVDS